jgi:RNA polymerase sigma factor (sigma-70 family)
VVSVSSRSDEALLLAARRDADAFADFYRRHARPLAGFLVRRTGDAEAAADLLAETFAAALTGLDRFDPARGDAVGWLYGIARHQLARRARRGAVEDRARRRLGMERLDLGDADLRAIEACDDATVALQSLPPDQREAVHARVVAEQDYAAIAAASRSTEPAVRQRVSRGLATLRKRLAREEQR